MEILRPWLFLFLPLTFLPLFLFRQHKERYRFLLRFVILSLLVFALSGPVFYLDSQQKNVVFVLDISASVELVYRNIGKDLIESYTKLLQTEKNSLSSHDRIAVIYFAKEAQLALPLTEIENISLNIARPEIDRNGSDLLKAINLAMNIVSSSKGKIIIVTDGAIPLSITNEVTKLVYSHNLRIETRPVPDLNNTSLIPDTRIEDFIFPSWIREGESAYSSVIFSTSMPGDFSVTLLSDNEILAKQNIALAKGGIRRLDFVVSFNKPGWHSVVAKVDSFSFNEITLENNRIKRGINLEKTLRILGVSRFEHSLMPLLNEGNWDLKIHLPSGFHLQDELLNRYDVLLLENVSALDLGKKALEIIEKWVYSGGGLIMLGNESSFALGGYAMTPVENALPLWCEPKDREALALVVAIDISGSMEGEKLSMVLEAVRGLVKELKEDDQLEILAFRTTPDVIFPLSHVDKSQGRIYESLHLSAGGGTDIVAALQKSMDDILPVPSNLNRHVLLLSDGYTAGGKEDEQKLFQIASMISSKGISLSVVAAGQEYHINIMKKLAMLGKGRFYEAKYNDLPGIFLNYIKSISLIENRGAIIHQGKSPVFAGFLNLNGHKINCYAVTQSKKEAEVIIETEKNHPIAAVWHYGLGRCAAMTTSPLSSWGGELNGPGGMNLLKQLLFWTGAKEREPFLTCTATKRAEDILLEVTSLKNGKPWNYRNFSALPTWIKEYIPLVQTGPGKYQACLPIPAQGAYKIGIFEDKSLKSDMEFSMPYPDELRRFGQTRFSLPTIPKQKNTDDTQKSEIIWPIIMAAILLYLGDLAMARH